MGLIRERLSFANVTSAIALFVALGGGAYAASGGFVGSNGAIHVCVGKHGALTAIKSGKKCARHTTTLTLDQQGIPGTQGNPGPPGPPGRSALAPLQSGETIRGTWALASNSGIAVTGITFPIPAPEPVDSYHVVVQGNDTEPGDGCTGSATAPVAAPGFVCIYFGSFTGMAYFAYGLGALSDASVSTNDSATGDGSPNGFLIKISPNPGFAANGVWTYTAP